MKGHKITFGKERTEFLRKRAYRVATIAATFYPHIEDISKALAKAKDYLEAAERDYLGESFDDEEALRAVERATSRENASKERQLPRVEFLKTALPEIVSGNSTARSRKSRLATFKDCFGGEDSLSLYAGGQSGLTNDEVLRLKQRYDNWWRKTKRKTQAKNASEKKARKKSRSAKKSRKT